MIHLILATALLGTLSFSSHATPIRVEFETTVTTAYDFRTKSTVDIAPISGRFSITFDEAGAEWARDEWGPYYLFNAERPTTPITASIPLTKYFALEPGKDQRAFSNSVGSGGWTDVGTVPLPGYGAGYDNQGFGFNHSMSRTEFVQGPYQSNLYESNRYSLGITLSRTVPSASFEALSTLEFLRLFVGSNPAGGTAALTESYQLTRYLGAGAQTVEGFRYTDRSLKVISVTDLSTEVSEPGSFALLAAGLAAVGALRRRQSKTPFKGHKQAI